MYYDDDLVFNRIEAKLSNFENTADILPPHSNRINNVLEIINERYSSSWKNDILNLFPQLVPNQESLEVIQQITAFIRSNEDCDLVLERLNFLLSMYDEKKSNRDAYRRIQSFLRHPQYDMLQIISGTSGSGKSSWIKQYFTFSLEKAQKGALSIVPVRLLCKAGITADQLDQMVQSQISFYLGLEYASLESINKRLQSLGDKGIKFCFIIEDIHILLNSGLSWDDVISTIKKYSYYDSFKWMITINEYELYLLETNQAFLKNYCISLSERDGIVVSKGSLSKHTLALDELNQNWKIVKEILRAKLNIDISEHVIDLEKSISTPSEAHIFCECLKNEDLSLISLPATYFDFFVIVAEQKNTRMKSYNMPDLPDTIDQVTNAVVRTHRCTVVPQDFNAEHLTALRNTQLIVRESEVDDDFFSTSYGFEREYYHLSIMAYWARAIAGKLPFGDNVDISSVNFLPTKLTEWLIPCYIFRYIKGDNKETLSKLIPILDKSDMLDYALFLARRTTTWYFSKELFLYLIDNPSCIKSARSCYAALYFIHYSNEYLSISEKFQLLMVASNAVKANKMLDVFERVFIGVVGWSSDCKKLKKNMLLLSAEKLPDINYITGYNAAEVFVRLWNIKRDDFETLFREYVIYLYEHPDLIAIVEDGNNKSFMDYFIRKCMECYIHQSAIELVDVYKMLEKDVTSTYEIYSRKHNTISKSAIAIIRQFLRRNFTCAAGNVFSYQGSKPQNYEEQYVNTVATFVYSKNLYEKKTAWHLLSNSKKDKRQALDKRLQKYADILKLNPKMQEWLGYERIKSL